MSKKSKKGVSRAALLKASERPPVNEVRQVAIPDLPAGVVPAGMALDSAMYDQCAAYANHQGVNLLFRGYGRLAQLAQLSEYRSPTQTLATEMTRQWIELKSTGDDRTEQIKAINAEIDRLKLRSVLKKTVENDGFFGRGMIYVDLGTRDNDQDPLIIDKATIKKGSLVGFRSIEPFWTTPANYNSTDPTDPDFYKPSMWYVMGRQIHATRLMVIVSQPVPDMLKPAYNFGGISMTQLLEPYVEAWLRTRKSISDLIKAFSISGLKTDMQSTLAGGEDENGENLFTRVELFNRVRDNRDLMVLDKDSEEFFQFNTPLSTLDALQAQSQEQMAAPCHIPLVKLFGITPSGLNATSEGEIKVWYDYVKAMQETLFTDPLVRILKIIQLHLFGEIYDDITFEYCPLEQMTEEQHANINKAKAEAAAALIEAGVISNDEERQRIVSDPSSGYNGLDAGELPDGEAEVTQPDTVE